MVREVEKDELRSQGLAINCDTMVRQGRFDPEFGEERQWNQLTDACYASAGIKVMGSFADGKLAAYAVTLVEDGWLHILHMFSGTQFLADYFPNSALAFQLTKMGMEMPEVDQVTFGVSGLSQSAGLHEFKERHGYEFVPYGYAFVLRPWAQAALVNPVSEWAMRKARARFSQHELLERVDSVMQGARLTDAQRAANAEPPAVSLRTMTEESPRG